jgi:hypothetical protein
MEADWRDVLRTAYKISAEHAFNLSCDLPTCCTSLKQRNWRQTRLSASTTSKTIWPTGRDSAPYTAVTNQEIDYAFSACNFLRRWAAPLEPLEPVEFKVMLPFALHSCKLPTGCFPSFPLEPVTVSTKLLGNTVTAAAESVKTEPDDIYDPMDSLHLCSLLLNNSCVRPNGD